MLYAAVGFGGGSTYNAILILTDINYIMIPIIALTCNLIVVSGNSLRYFQNNLIPWKFTLPVVGSSIPFAFAGGLVMIDEVLFIKILAWALLFSGLMMLYRKKYLSISLPKFNKIVVLIFSCVLAACLGFIAGLVGIGGGIFFAPLLHLTQLLPVKNIAAFSSFFILVNSSAGLIGQFIKYDGMNIDLLESKYFWLLLAVFVGGQIGSHLSVHRIQPIVVRRLTAVLVIYVGCRLLFI